MPADRQHWTISSLGAVVNGLAKENLRICQTCGSELPMDQFPLHGRYRRRSCRNCTARKRRAYRATLTPAIREKALDVMAAWGMAIKRTEIEMQRAKQRGLCAICSIPMTRGRGNTGQNVDHDHATFKPRGLLCKECNRKVARFEEVHLFPPDYAAKIREYLAAPPWRYNGAVDADLIRHRMRHRTRSRLRGQGWANPAPRP